MISDKLLSLRELLMCFYFQEDLFTDCDFSENNLKFKSEYHFYSFTLGNVTVRLAGCYLAITKHLYL